jgi:hypothetical protein
MLFSGNTMCVPTAADTVTGGQSVVSKWSIFHPDSPFLKVSLVYFKLRYFESLGVHDNEMFQKPNA